MDARLPPGVLWCIPALLLVHNVEEALAMPRLLPLVRARLPEAAAPLLPFVSYPVFAWALVLATVVPFGIAAWAAVRPGAGWAHWTAALVQAVVALNVASHLAAAVALRGYTPGVVTALAVNLPFSVWLFRRARREGWLSRRALSATIPAAVLVHGPGLLALLAVARLLASAGR